MIEGHGKDDRMTVKKGMNNDKITLNVVIIMLGLDRKIKYRSIMPKEGFLVPRCWWRNPAGMTCVTCDKFVALSPHLY